MPSQKIHEALLRQWALLKCLSSYNQTTQQVHQKLIEQGIEISERTVLRDLQQLEEAGLPVKSTDSKPFNWRIEKEWQDRVGGMTESEALLALLVKEYLQEILPSTMTKQLNELFVMAEKKLNTHHANQASQWFTKVRVIAAQQSQLPPSIEDNIKNTISQALIDNQVIRTTYKGYESLLSPLALVMRGQVIYLAATDFNEPDKVKHFALHRFNDAEIAYGEPFYNPANFSIDKLLEEGWGHFQHQHDEKMIRLECWCHVDLKRHLAEMRLADNQWLDFKKPVNDRYWLKVDLPYTWQLKQWLLSQGSRIEVIKPVWLREELTEEIVTMLKNYQ
ncbi:MAG: WYL domain-containing transcriptional regulator [Pseudomonadales bacterium]|nr:WYL domain-containing transcriptional regulator [Pseudomonadales bacterium]